MALLISGLGCAGGCPGTADEGRGIGGLGIADRADGGTAWISLFNTGNERNQAILFAISKEVTALALMERARYNSPESIKAYPVQLVGFLTRLVKATAGLSKGAFKVKLPVALTVSVDTISEPHRSQAIDAFGALWGLGFLEIMSNAAFFALPTVQSLGDNTGVAGLGALGWAPLIPIVILVCAVAVGIGAWAFASGVENFFHAQNAYTDCVIANAGNSKSCGEPPGDSMGSLKWIVLGVGGIALLVVLAPMIKDLTAPRIARTA